MERAECRVKSSICPKSKTKSARQAGILSSYIKQLQKDYVTLKKQYELDQAEIPKGVIFFDKSKQKIQEGNQIDEVDMIIGLRKRQGKKEYLVRWKGKTGADATWVTKKWLKPLKEMVRFFHENYYKQHFSVDEQSSSGFSSTPIVEEDDQPKSLASRFKSQISKNTNLKNVSKQDNLKSKQQPFKPQILIKPTVEVIPEKQIQAEPTVQKVVEKPQQDVNNRVQEESKSNKEQNKKSNIKVPRQRAKLVKNVTSKENEEKNDLIVTKLRSQSKQQPSETQIKQVAGLDVKTKKIKKFDKPDKNVEVLPSTEGVNTQKDRVQKSKHLVWTKLRDSKVPIELSKQRSSRNQTKEAISFIKSIIQQNVDPQAEVLAPQEKQKTTKLTKKLAKVQKTLEVPKKVNKQGQIKKSKQKPKQKLKQEKPTDINNRRITRGSELKDLKTKSIVPNQIKKEQKTTTKPVKVKLEQEAKKDDKLQIQTKSRVRQVQQEIPPIVKKISKRVNPKVVLKTRSQVRQHLGDGWA